MMNETEKLLLDAQRAIERNDSARALVAADELLKRDPTQVDALFQAGVALMRAGNVGLALQLFNVARAATQDRAKLAAIWNNIGACLQDYRPDEAYQAFRKALTFGDPRETYDNLCNVASQIGLHKEALEWADKSDRIGKDASYNRSFALFALGRWAEAWECFDKSIPQRDGAARSYGLPRWDGKGGRPIVHGEQGIGDEFLFMSMLPHDYDGLIECDPRNASLFQRSFPESKVYGTRRETYLEWIPDERPTHEIEMGGLGRLFAPKPFVRGAFLRAPEKHVLNRDALRTSFGASGPLIGIAWTGGSWSTGRSRRSIPFHEVVRAFRGIKATFVCLEYEDRSEELRMANLPWLQPSWATKKGADMDDLAALVASLDLVIAPTTSVVDLAGGLGVPCFAMVDQNPQWRYSDAAGEQSMWFYESVRTFRQKPDDKGKWGRVTNEVAAAVREMFS